MNALRENLLIQYLRNVYKEVSINFIFENGVWGFMILHGILNYFSKTTIL